MTRNELNCQKKYPKLSRDNYFKEQDSSKDFSGIKRKIVNNPKKRSNYRWVYPKSDVAKIWIKLFAEIGDFTNLGKALFKKYGKIVKGGVVRRNIQKVFEEAEEDYYSWYYKFANPRSIRYTQDDALKLWKPAFEKIGSWKGVEKYLKEKYKYGPTAHIIRDRITKLFKEKGWDFEEWYSKFAITFTEKDVIMWKILYEQLGTFFELEYYLEEYYKELNKKHPTFTTITNRLKEYINGLRDRGDLSYDYEEWKKRYFNRKTVLEDRTEDRIEIEIPERKKIFEELQQRGYRLKDIYRIIGSHLKIFHEPYLSLSLEIFEKLSALLGREFPYKIKPAYGKWMKFTFNDFANYLEKILTIKLKKDLRLKSWQAPSSTQLKLYGHGDFIGALKNYNINYKDLVEAIGLVAPTTELNSTIGMLNHPIAEYIFMDFAREKNLFALFEIMPSRNDNQNRSDNALMRDKNFRRLVEEFIIIIKFLDNIKMVNFDYQMGINIARFIEKSLKGYHGGDKHLIIVILNIDSEDIEIPANIPFKKNYSILNASQFAKFMGYHGKHLELFNRMIELSIDAFYNETALKELELLSKNAKKALSLYFYKDQNEKLEDYLRRNNLMYLLNEEPIQKNKNRRKSDLAKWF